MYVVVRRDLPLPQRYVQGMHAVAEYLLRFPTEWLNGTMICVDVDNEIELYKLQLKLSHYRFASFVEPDMNDQNTAIAGVDLDPKLMKKLQCSRP
jgi:hypothetical protein